MDNENSFSGNAIIGLILLILVIVLGIMIGKSIIDTKKNDELLGEWYCAEQRTYYSFFSNHTFIIDIPSGDRYTYEYGVYTIDEKSKELNLDGTTGKLSYSYFVTNNELLLKGNNENIKLKNIEGTIKNVNALEREYNRPNIYEIADLYKNK